MAQRTQSKLRGRGKTIRRLDAELARERVKGPRIEDLVKQHQAAIGIVLPATAEPEGYHAEKAKGNIKVIPAARQVRIDYLMGALTAVDAKRMESKIKALVP
jgi:hypothetical protein